jgi:protein SCO1/2
LRALLAVALPAFIAGSATPAAGQLLMDDVPKDVRGVEVVERLGERLPTRLTFRDSDGETVALTSVFDGDKPVVVVPVYFGCPVVCPLILERLTNSFRELDYTIGDGFEVLIFSIDPGEGQTESWAAKTRYTEAYRAGADRDAADVAAGWHFVTGDETSIAELTDACGWHFNALSNGEFGHPTAIMIASPDGVLTRYIYGFDFPPKQMKLSLLDASEGRIAASFGDRLLHYCYRFDPSSGAYTMEAMAVMRVAGVLTVIGLVVLIGGLFAWERTRTKHADKKNTNEHAGPGDGDPKNTGPAIPA